MKGHIRIGIDKLIYFEPDGLDKPDEHDYVYGFGGYLHRDKKKYNKAMKAYEASKQLVEVENVKQIQWLYFFYFGSKVIMHPDYELKNNQPCTAKITDNKATIISLSD